MLKNLKKLLAAGVVVAMTGCSPVVLGPETEGASEAPTSGTETDPTPPTGTDNPPPTTTDPDTTTSGTDTTHGDMTGFTVTTAMDTTTGTPDMKCGDGVRDPGEECDEGDNNGPGKVCSAECTLNSCGDGVIDLNVGPCDPGCANTLNCTADCQYAPNVCGNGIQEFPEQCDNGPDNGADKPCKIDCTVNPLDENVCGNGVVEAPEKCDLGTKENKPNGPDCNHLCQPLDQKACQEIRCGDGKKEGDEQCDDGNTDDHDGCTASCIEEGLLLDGCGAYCHMMVQCFAEEFPMGFCSEFIPECVQQPGPQMCKDAIGAFYQCIGGLDCQALSMVDVPGECKGQYKEVVDCGEMANAPWPLLNALPEPLN